MSNLFCSQCGAHNRPDGEYCRNCGALLARPSESLQHPPASPPPQSSTYQPPVMANQFQSPPAMPPQMSPAHHQPYAPGYPQGQPTVVVNQFAAPQLAVSSNKSRTSYILLGLFLGSLGVHNFYAGYAGRGVAQLLITLFLGWLILPLFFIGLWVIIEVITVKTDARGALMI